MASGGAERFSRAGALGTLTFSVLYVIYIVAENRPDLCRKVQSIDIGLTEY